VVSLQKNQNQNQNKNKYHHHHNREEVCLCDSSVCVYNHPTLLATKILINPRRGLAKFIQSIVSLFVSPSHTRSFILLSSFLLLLLLPKYWYTDRPTHHLTDIVLFGYFFESKEKKKARVEKSQPLALGKLAVKLHSPHHILAVTVLPDRHPFHHHHHHCYCVEEKADLRVGTPDLVRLLLLLLLLLLK